MNEAYPLAWYTRTDAPDATPRILTSLVVGSTVTVAMASTEDVTFSAPIGMVDRSLPLHVCLRVRPMWTVVVMLFP